jgi:nicotinate-nucleotide adenylyltransferase
MVKSAVDRKSRRMRIGIFGGSFNPIHNGHLKLAAEARKKLGLGQVVFVPSKRSPLKSGEPLLPAGLRLKLLRSALRGKPYFQISLCEIRRRGVSFTIDTLRFFRKKLGPKHELFFLAGADTLDTLSKWKSLDRILRLCRFVVMTRPGYKLKKVLEGIQTLEFDALDISASDIRRRLRKGESLKGLVPRPVENFLRRDKLSQWTKKLN